MKLEASPSHSMDVRTTIAAVSMRRKRNALVQDAYRI